MVREGHLMSKTGKKSGRGIQKFLPQRLLLALIASLAAAVLLPKAQDYVSEGPKSSDK